MSDFVHIESPSTEAVQPLSTEEDLAASPNLQKEESSKNDLEFLDLHPFVRSTVVDKIYGCLVGSALGDTIGLYTEFLPKAQCAEAYKTRKFSLVGEVTEYYSDSHRMRFEPCAWTDDTDQALLILLSYLHIHTSSSPRNATPELVTALPQDFAGRLQIWIEQGLRALNRFPCGIGRLVGSVVTNKAYLLNPVEIAIERWVKSSRHVAPNGSLMRTHPIGVIGVGMEEVDCWILATSVGMTTHVDPRCTVACCISVGLVRGILRGEVSTEADVDKAIEKAYDWVLSQPELMNPGLATELTEWEIKRHLDRKEFERHVYVTSYADLYLDNHQEMGYVYKCLGSAILALRLCIRACASALPSKSLFEDLITDLIMEGGDSDTNGAAAGALIGAYLGYANLPAHWALGLAHKEWLSSKIMRLTKALEIVDGTVEEEADEQSDGGKGLMSKEELEKRDRNMLVLILTRKKEREEKERKAKEKKKGLAGWFAK
ncbi:ADP-ribosylglycohydrolase [Lentithecium fluviatile CBS 122367]|uniref:ADP-ribosylglycohydrolase n=1 Tax=Lentithecium fluviatile CBS 122367 TaxID=1168545 RepID=A0A6G1J0A5_9PLEO|nr:ADP-ribosylglycohydrolase [Lentithecium fluviatile CBS 122367]